MTNQFIQDEISMLFCSEKFHGGGGGGGGWHCNYSYKLQVQVSQRFKIDLSLTTLGEEVCIIDNAICLCDCTCDSGVN